MLLLFLFVLLFVLCVCGFFRDSSMIAIGTAEFIYYVAIIIPLNLGKP